MADHSKPALTDLYTNYTSNIKGRLDDIAKGMDPATIDPDPTNVPTNTIRWSSVSGKWEKYNGASWVDLTATYAINISGNAATASTVSTNPSHTGDVTSGGDGVTTIANNAVTNEKFRDSGACSVIGRSANTTGDPADIAAGANDRLLARVSNALQWVQLTIGMIADKLITYAKIQDVSATDRVLGRQSAGAGVIEEIACTAAGRAILAGADANAQLVTLGGGARGISVFKATTLDAVSDITGNLGGAYISTNTNTAIDASYQGRTIRCYAGITLTLAASSGFSAGWMCIVHNRSGSDVTIARDAGDTIDGAASSYTVPAGQTRVILLAVATYWEILKFSPIRKEYYSAAQTITSAGLLTLAHNFGERPKVVSAELHCTVADAGYAVGDVIAIGADSNVALVGSDVGHSIIAGTANLYVRFGASATVYRALHKTTGATTALTNSSWQVRFRALA